MSSSGVGGFRPGSPDPTGLPAPEAQSDRGSAGTTTPNRAEGGVVRDDAANQRRRQTSRITGSDLANARNRATEGTRPVAGVKVEASTPSVVVKPVDILERVDSGTIEVAVRMRAGYVLSRRPRVTIREDTYATAKIVIKPGGEIDTERTKIEFRDSDGNLTDLDGPLFFDPDEIYIEDGKIFADVPCFPDKDITDKLMGGDEKVPKDAAGFIQALTRGAGGPSFTAVEGASTNPDQAPAGAVPDTEGGSKRADLINQILDLSDVTIRESKVKLKSGRIDFGTGTSVLLRPNTEVEIDGDLKDLSVRVTAPVLQ